MKSLFNDHTARAQLSLVHNDRVMSAWPGADAPSVDVPEGLGEPGPRHVGRSIAMDITMTDLRKRFPASHFIGVGIIYEDDPAAEFEDVTSCDAMVHTSILAA
jgi:hypothetical protein